MEDASCTGESAPQQWLRSALSTRRAIAAWMLSWNRRIISRQRRRWPSAAIVSRYLKTLSIAPCARSPFPNGKKQKTNNCVLPLSAVGRRHQSSSSSPILLLITNRINTTQIHTRRPAVSIVACLDSFIHTEFVVVVIDSSTRDEMADFSRKAMWQTTHFLFLVKEEEVFLLSSWLKEINDGQREKNQLPKGSKASESGRRRPWKKKAETPSGPENGQKSKNFLVFFRGFHHLV